MVDLSLCYMPSKHDLAKFTRALGLLKSAKLEYLKTAEGRHSTEVQRFLHRQARLRHHFFQELEVKIRALFANEEVLHISGAQMEQRLVASMTDTQVTDYKSCIEIDNKIIESLNNLEEVEIDTKELLLKLGDAQRSLLSFQKKTNPKSNSWF